MELLYVLRLINDSKNFADKCAMQLIEEKTGADFEDEIKIKKE